MSEEHSKDKELLDFITLEDDKEVIAMFKYALKREKKE